MSVRVQDEEGNKALGWQSWPGLFSYRARAGASHFRLSFLVKFEFTLFNKWVRLPCMLVLYGTCRV